jgi:hypothetical protein
MPITELDVRNYFCDMPIARVNLDAKTITTCGGRVVQLTADDILAIELIKLTDGDDYTSPDIL